MKTKDRFGLRIGSFIKNLEVSVTTSNQLGVLLSKNHQKPENVFTLLTLSFISFSRSTLNRMLLTASNKILFLKFFNLLEISIV